MFLHQTEHFCYGLAFILHDNGVLGPLNLKLLKVGFIVQFYEITTSTVATTKPLKHSTVHPKHVEYDNSLLVQIQAIIIILELKLWLNLQDEDSFVKTKHV